MDADEYLYFIDRAFDGMLCAIRELGDEHANQTPPTAGANSPWAIAYHCTEVADYWIGHLIAGRVSRRNRAAEFFAHGTVGELADRIDRLRRKLRTDLTNFSPSAPLVNTPPADYEGPSRELTAAGVLLHVLEELAQHHGQVQMSRDILNQTAQARS